MLGNYLFTEHKPLRNKVLSMLPTMPMLLERKANAGRTTAMVVRFVGAFISGLGMR